MNSEERKYDDLTQIKSIGPARQQWLRDALNIRTFSDLAALSLEEIETALRAEGQRASRNEIETWVAQAKELSTPTVEEIQQWLQDVLEIRTFQELATFSPEAIETALGAEGERASRNEIERWIAQAKALSAPTVEDVTRNENATAIVIKTKEADSVPRANEWRAFSQFGIEFQERTVDDRPTKEYQTTVHQIDTDNRASWSGIESKQVGAWIQERVRDLVGFTVAPEQAEAEATIRIPLRVAVTQVKIFQPLHIEIPTATSTAEQSFQGIVKGAEPFAVAVDFDLAGQLADEAVQRTTYFAQFYARALSTGSSKHLGDTEPTLLRPGQTSYTARLRTASLLPGIYRLQVVVSLPDRPTSTGFLEIPLLQIV